MATPTAITSSPTLGGESPISNGGGSGIQSLLQSGQISGDLKSLVTLLGSQSGSGITLEQLLSATTSTSRLATPTGPSSPQGGGAWSTGRKRGRAANDTPLHLKRRRVSSSKQTGEKQQGKGLRHFSQRVCEKVKEKGTTSYNEVADELVKELSGSEFAKDSSGLPIDQKNIRRRVYDALNVLTAMNIISKEKKEIKWIGLPTNSVQECQHVEDELSKVEQRVQTKRGEVESLLIQILSFKNLMKRNRERVASLGTPAQNSSISLPFILVNTGRKSTIDCSISSDKSEYVFNFDNPFELHNDIEVLKKMGLDCGLHSGTCTPEDIRTAKAMLPKAFASTLDQLVATKTTAVSSSTPMSTPDTIHTSTPFTPQDTTPLASESPFTKEQLISALGQTLQASSHSPGGKPSSPVVVPATPVSGGIPSPQAVTALVNSVMRGTKVHGSPVLSAKATMHSHCPSSTQQVPVSPLVKSSTSTAEPHLTTPLTPTSVKSVGSPSTPGSQQKIVTVSKLPSPEQFTSLLQKLQQSSSLSKLISTAASRQLFQDSSSTSAGSTSATTQAHK